MKKFKSLMLLIATMLILTIAFCMNASAAEWTDVYENVQYTFDKETGVMVIKGEGSLNGWYFSEICYDHYAPKYDLCSCLSDDGEWDAPEIDHPGYFDARATKTLIIQEGITSIDVRAFYGFISLEVAILPQSLTEIPAGAFSDLKKLHTVVLSNSITTIGEEAFYNCTNLKNIYMADTLKTVGKDAFYGCDKEIIRIPSSAVVETEKPLPARDVTVNAKEYEATITWEKSSNAEGYVVEVAGKKITTKETYCKVNSLLPGKSYSCYVTPYVTNNGKVVYGDASWEEFTTKPEAPKVSVKKISSDKITISWSDNNDSVNYGIYSETGNGSWYLHCVVYDDKYGNVYEFSNLKPGTKYSFAVRPVTVGRVEILGNYTAITAATTPATVTAKPASPSKGKITLTWNGVSGDIDGYRVYYKLGNGVYKIYKNFATPQNLTFTNLKSGSKYTFAVRAGIKTSGGIVWSGYKEVPVTVK